MSRYVPRYKRYKIVLLLLIGMVDPYPTRAHNTASTTGVDHGTQRLQLVTIPHQLRSHMARRTKWLSAFTDISRAGHVKWSGAIMTQHKTSKLITQINRMGFHVCLHNDHGALIIVSAEHGDSAADYYGEYRGGYPWINPKLEQLAQSNHCFWEWHNPGAIGLYEA